MPRRLFPVVLGLLVLTRAALVLSCADVFFYGEELAKGTAAKALLDGLPVEWLLKNYGIHEGGGFTVSHLKALAFLLVGENVLAHKLVALGLTASILLAGWILSRAHFGERAALAFGLLFVFCPAPFVRFSLLSLGTHFEASLFIAIALHLSLEIAKTEAPKARHLLGLGLASGFGAYFSLLTLPASACAAAWVIGHRRGRLIGREALLLLAGLAAGALPLVAGLLRVGRAAVVPIQASSPHASLAAAFGGLGSALGGARFLGWASCLAFVTGAAISVARSRPARLLAAWLGLYFAMYLASGLATENTNWFFLLRLAPLWFGGILLFGAGYQIVSERSRLASVALAVLAAAGVLDWTGLLAEARPGSPIENARRLVRTQGYDYGEYLDKFLKHLDGDAASKVGIVRHFREDARELAPELAGSLLGRPDADLGASIDLWHRAYGEGFELGLQGLGVAVDPSYGHQLEAGFTRIEAQPEPFRAGLAEGLGRIALGLKYDEEKLRSAAAVHVPAELRTPYLRGCGWRLYKLHRLRPDLSRAFLETLPPDACSEVERGWREATEVYSTARTD